jgi:adenylate cyclase
VLTLSSTKSDRIYSQDEVEILTPLLSNAAFAFENLLLVKTTQRTEAYVRAIEKVFTILNSSFRSTELLHAVLNEIRAVVPFDLAVVLRRTPNHRSHATVQDIMSTGPAAITKGTRLDCSGAVIEKVFKQENSLLIESNTYLAHPADRKVLGNRAYGTYLLTPLKTDGTVNGVLALAVYGENQLEAAKGLVNWIANGLSLAIERNRLSEAVAKRSQELETIQRIGSALASSTFDINKVLKYTMDMIREVMNVEAGSLWFLEKDELEIAVAFNAKIKALKKFRIKIGQGIAGYVAARGEPITVNSIERSPHFFPIVDESSGFKTRSALCVPMISQGKVIGVIEVLNKLKGDFDTDDRDLLQSITTSVCIALENARLYKETVSMAQHERDVRQMFQKFVPKEVVDKITHGAEKGKPVIEELKTITLLNIDIRGFSLLAKQIGSQKTVSLLNSFFSVMGGIVFKHHGIVDKYLGDGFLSLFGAPVSSTSDADNAISAAIEMKKAMSAVNRFLQRELSTEVSMGISIHTGEVVVGNIGFEKKMDYTVIGDAVNTVFRLQELTKSNENSVLISENTLRAARSRLNIEEITPPPNFVNSAGGLKVFELRDQTLEKRVLPLPVNRKR